MPYSPIRATQELFNRRVTSEILQRARTDNPKWKPLLERSAKQVRMLTLAPENPRDKLIWVLTLRQSYDIVARDLQNRMGEIPDQYDVLSEILRRPGFKFFFQDTQIICLICPQLDALGE